MELLLIGVPLAAALLALAIPSNRLRPLVVPVGAVAHLALLIPIALDARTVPGSTDWVRLDSLGALALGVISVLFSIVALYVPGYLATRAAAPNRTFCACLLGFLSAASFVTMSQHLGLQWISMEAATLLMAPLLYFNRNTRSLEATWKYLVIGSVGIALGLLGTFALAYAGQLGKVPPPFVFERLIALGARLSHPWVRIGFVLMLVGYGTKMGLAPLHAWKPDAYGEAPGLVGALLAGGLTTCAFLALLRGYSVVSAAGEGPFARQLFVVMGLASLVAAAIFMVRQADLKRMLAYSSVEHMGILVLGIGLGGAATRFSLLHLMNNAFTKTLLFLAVGNVHRAFGSKTLQGVAGALRRLPLSSGLFLAGFFAVTGSPPFAPFVSELGILRGALEQGSYFVGTAYLLLLGIIFMGMSWTVIAAFQGEVHQAAPEARFRDSVAMTGPIVLALGLVVMLGVWIPDPVMRLVDSASAVVRGGQNVN